MKLDPGIHIAMFSVLSFKPSVTRVVRVGAQGRACSAWARVCAWARSRKEKKRRRKKGEGKRKGEKEKGEKGKKEKGEKGKEAPAGFVASFASRVWRRREVMHTRNEKNRESLNDD